MIYRDIDFTILSKIMSLGSRKFWMRSCMSGGSTSIVWRFCLRFELQVCELVITRCGTQWFNHSSCTRTLEACRLYLIKARIGAHEQLKLCFYLWLRSSSSAVCFAWFFPSLSCTATSRFLRANLSMVGEKSTDKISHNTLMSCDH